MRSVISSHAFWTWLISWNIGVSSEYWIPVKGGKRFRRESAVSYNSGNQCECGFWTSFHSSLRTGTLSNLQSTSHLVNSLPLTIARCKRKTQSFIPMKDWVSRFEIVWGAGQWDRCAGMFLWMLPEAFMSCLACVLWMEWNLASNHGEAGVERC